MIRYDRQSAAEAPAAPNFLEAKNRRQKARSAGMNPDYWYPVESPSELGRGKVVGTKFWGRSIALFRDETACSTPWRTAAPTASSSSPGQVEGCNLVCTYHGWEYDGDGKAGQHPPRALRQADAADPHRRVPGAGALRPDLDLPRRPRARTPPHPRHPRAAGRGPWGLVPIDFKWRGHHSMVIDNVSDFTHAYLHRRCKPFIGRQADRLEVGGRQGVACPTRPRSGAGASPQYFVDRRDVDTDAMDLGYEYPYQWSNTDGKIKHCCFVLPIDETHTRAFFLFYFKTLVVPVRPSRFRAASLNCVLGIANKLHITPAARRGRGRGRGRAGGLRRALRRAHRRAQPRGDAVPAADHPQVGRAPRQPPRRKTRSTEPARTH